MSRQETGQTWGDHCQASGRSGGSEGEDFAAEPGFPPAQEGAPGLERLAQMSGAGNHAQSQGDRASQTQGWRMARQQGRGEQKTSGGLSE